MTYRFLRSTYTPAVFLAGVLVGAAVMAVDAQSSRLTGNHGINHVGIVVDRLDEAIATYGKAFGFGEAAVLRDEKGQPTLAFIQVSRNTFIELSLASATPNRFITTTSAVIPSPSRSGPGPQPREPSVRRLRLVLGPLSRAFNSSTASASASGPCRWPAVNTTTGCHHGSLARSIRRLRCAFKPSQITSSGRFKWALRASRKSTTSSFLMLPWCKRNRKLVRLSPAITETWFQLK